MRASSHIQLKERKQLTLEGFKGVDFSSSPLRVRTNKQMEEGYISQKEVDDALELWVNDLDGKTKEEVEASGMSIARDEWFV